MAILRSHFCIVLFQSVILWYVYFSYFKTIAFCFEKKEKKP